MLVCIGGDSCFCGSISAGYRICNSAKNRKLWTASPAPGSGGPCGAFDLFVTQDDQGNYTLHYGCHGEVPAPFSYTFQPGDFLSQSPLYAVSQPQSTLSQCGYPGGLVRFSINGGQTDCGCYTTKCACRHQKTPDQLIVTVPPALPGEGICDKYQPPCDIQWVQFCNSQRWGGLCTGGGGSATACKWGGTYVLVKNSNTDCAWDGSFSASTFCLCYPGSCVDCAPNCLALGGLHASILSDRPIKDPATGKLGLLFQFWLMDGKSCLGSIGARWKQVIYGDSTILPMDCCAIDHDVNFDQYLAGNCAQCYGAQQLGGISPCMVQSPGTIHVKSVCF